MYPQPLLHVPSAPQFEQQQQRQEQQHQQQHVMHPQQGPSGGDGAQWQQQRATPGDQTLGQRHSATASGKASPLSREPYPVVVHCETDLPSRTVSSDPAAHYLLLSRGQTNATNSGGGGGGAPVLGGALAAAEQQQQQQRHMLQMASWLVPDHRRTHWAIFTSLVVLGMSFVFAFMAGDYATWLRTPAAAAALGGAPAPASEQEQWGPAGLVRWLRFWELRSATVYNPVYLFAWGARYTPSVKAGQWWRLFSSFCLHSSFTHLLSNMALFLLLTVPLEHTYGPIRVAVIFLASAFGANFLSMTFEDPCVLYVGASGAVFGFVGLAISDLLLNWDTVGAPVVRLLVMLAMLGLSIAVEYMELPYMSIG
ncbi:rhomboid-like protease [Monoraphidium neglectum]|uniref:RHOMBOID-like protein n=1 Tax=Monoraphidium neglectum TaxID=145388 RepID=A0A0D2MEC1_9CHLO|nr:rhomboid-like protease [Monoraphidium neglectum]KIY93520.1 rhomboid-like protease [Monoraphidium neglectum]|eukprot:XP_013892540.1 rhomboid-like protease [Monoraphidium neglectum]